MRSDSYGAQLRLLTQAWPPWFVSLLNLSDFLGIVVSWPVTIAVVVFTWWLSRVGKMKKISPPVAMCMSCGIVPSA